MNAPAQDSTAHLTVVDAFAAAISAHPDATAVEAQNGTLTYAELDRRSAAVAAALRAHGVEPGDLVGVCLGRTTELVSALLGVMRCGAAYVPIDPNFPPPRIAQMVEDSRARALLSERSLQSLVDSLGCDQHGTAVVWADEIGDAAFESVPVRSSDLAYVIYTSGSTGRPKGVMVEHGGLINLLESTAAQLALGPSDVFVSVTTVSFDIAALELFTPLIVGAAIRLATVEQAIDGERLSAVLRASPKATVLQATPATWRLLLGSEWAGDPELSALIGGEALPRDLADALVPKVGVLWNMYGPTETTIWSTRQRVMLDRPGMVPIGAAIERTTLHLVGEDGQPVPDGELGELWIGGAGVARGYFGREDLTAERFVPDPFGARAGEAARLYRTGDLCRRDEHGVLEFHGRLDHQVKIRGYRIELGDIENTLEGYAPVRQAIVGIRGEDQDKVLVGYFVAADGAEEAQLSVEAFRQHCAASLPWYMVPHAFARVDAMPLTPNRKVDRRALAELDIELPGGGEGGPPRGDVELMVARAFQAELGVENVGRDDDFFALGGHSLQAFQLVQGLSGLLGRELSVGTLFAAPTVAKFAAAAEATEETGQARAVIELAGGVDGPPLLCLCGVAIYQPLADALRGTVTTCALFIEDEVELFRGEGELPVAGVNTPRVEELADLYLPAILERQPDGPYRLCGISMGGAVALEIARRLRAQGREVELVAMFDTFLRDSMQRRPVRFVLHHLARLSGKALAKVTGRRSGGSESAAAVGEQLGVSDPREQRVAERAWAAMLAYRPEAYDGPVTLFRSVDRERAWHYRYDETLGWAHRVGELTMHDVSGDHLGIMKQPAVEEIAAQLRRLWTR